MGVISQGGPAIDRKQLIIAVSGRMASGKTTLAKALADAVGGQSSSFGDYVRHLAMKHGGADDRGRLQAIGQAAVEADPRSFVADFLRWTGPMAASVKILDGLRHVSVRDALRAFAEEEGIALVFVHVEADDERRRDRLRARGDDETTLAAYEGHVSEQDARDRLRDEAHVVVERSDHVSEMVSKVLTDLGIKDR